MTFLNAPRAFSNVTLHLIIWDLGRLPCVWLGGGACIDGAGAAGLAGLAGFGGAAGTREK